MRKLCRHCGFDFQINVISDRTGTKYLRAGCCDAFLRRCPEPSELLRSASLTASERDYLQRLTSVSWFGGKTAAILLQIEARIEAKVKASMGVKNA